MNFTPYQRIAMSALLVGPLILTGCLERKETITVRPDHSVRIALEYTGTEKELAGPDAMPSAATGWQVERSVKKEGDEEKQVLEATADFAAGAALPGSYARAGGPYLEFPTEVRVEQRGDAEFVHFRRVYRRRPFARFEYWNSRFIDDDIKKIADKPAEEMTFDERVRLLRAFANAEAHKRVEIAHAAVDSALPDISQDAWLLARQSLCDVFDQLDLGQLARDIEGLDEEARDKKVSVLAETVPEEAKAAFVATLTKEAGLDANAVDRLRSALETENLRLNVTHSTRTHGFQIALRLPGKIVAHNGDRVEDGAIIWEFGGNAFCDRDFELLATARNE